MPQLAPDPSHLMLLAGISLAAWFLIRLQIRRRRSSGDTRRQLTNLRDEPQSRGMPLADAPPALLRWQAEMFDMQRELTAELDTKAAVVASLLRQAEDALARLETATAKVERGSRNLVDSHAD